MIGSAHGLFLKELANLGYKVVGLEMDPELAKWSRKRTGRDIRLEAIENIEGEFDAVVASDVLEHEYDPKQFVAQACGF